MDGSAAAQQTPHVEQVIGALIDGKLAKYLLDTDTAHELIKEIAEETGLPRAAVRIAFKLLAPLLIEQGQVAGGWFGRKLIGRSAGLLVNLPGYELVAGRLLSLHAKLDADVTRRRQLDAILAGERPASDLEHAEGLSKDLRLGLRELAELEVMRAYIGDQFDRLFEVLNPQPPLILKLLERTEINRLKFGARRVPFIGRRAEMERLCEFLDTPGAFSWWLVTGSGGQGKSRLAVEFCLRAGTAWRAGFLPETLTFDGWDTWQPETGTLIVVDYVATRAEQLRGIIASLRNRQHVDPLDAPVRLLLLERSKERFWWDQLIGTDQTGYAIEECQFARESLDLGPMSEDDLWQTIVSVLEEVGKSLPDREETVRALDQIDPERRPLFAAFAADALSTTSNIRGWDRERLLRDVLERERRHHWLPAGVNVSYENLLCLATMTGGLKISPQTHLPGIELPRFEEFRPQIYRAMTGALPVPSGNGSLALMALQPDILGEFFVLEHLMPPHGATNKPAEKFRYTAWNISIDRAFFFAAFLNRAKGDFLDHPTLHLLVTPAISTDYQRRLWSALAVNLIHAHGDERRLDEAQRIFDLLRQLEVDHPDDPVIRPLLAHGAYNLITSFGKAGDLEGAVRNFDLLRQLQGNHQNERQIRLVLANSAYNLTGFLGNAGRLDKAQCLFDLLNQFATDHQEEVEVSLELAKAAVNLVRAYGQRRRPDEARACLGFLRQFAAGNPDLTEAHLRLAQGALNLTDAYRHTGQLDRVGACLDLLQQLEADHPDDPDVRLCLARGIGNIVFAFANAQRFDEARRHFDLLGELEATHEDDSQTRLVLATSAFSLITSCAEADHLDEAQRLFDLLHQLALDHPDEAEVRLELAKGAVNLIAAYRNKRRPKEGRACLDVLRQFAPDYPDVRLRLAQGAFNQINAYREAGQLDQAGGCLELLRQLEANYPGHPEVRLLLTQAAANLISDHGNAMEIHQSRLYLDLLHRLEADHPDEPELRLELAKGAFNLISACRNTGWFDNARVTANAAKRALMSAQFAVVLRDQFGEEAAAQEIEWLRSLLDT